MLWELSFFSGLTWEVCKFSWFSIEASTDYGVWHCLLSIISERNPIGKDELTDSSARSAEQMLVYSLCPRSSLERTWFSTSSTSVAAWSSEHEEMRFLLIMLGVKQQLGHQNMQCSGWPSDLLWNSLDLLLYMMVLKQQALESGFLFWPFYSALSERSFTGKDKLTISIPREKILIGSWPFLNKLPFSVAPSISEADWTTNLAVDQEVLVEKSSALDSLIIELPLVSVSGSSCWKEKYSGLWLCSSYCCTWFPK